MKDPFRYFRIEAQELLEGLDRGLLEVEQQGDDPSTRKDSIRKLLRFAHTLKGAARVVKQLEVGDLAHQLEDLLEPMAESGVAREGVSAALALVDSMREHLGSLAATPAAARDAPPGETRPEGTAERGDASESVVRLAIRDLDALLVGLAEATGAAASIRRDERELQAAAQEVERGSRFDVALHRLGSHVQELTAELREVRALVTDLRLVPAEVLVSELERTARDVAYEAGKLVRTRTTGVGIRLDAFVLASLRGALRHVVSNAVAHGIEEPVARAAAGKPPEGIVDISLERRGQRVLVRIADDGHGVDWIAVRRVMVERGLVRPEEEPGLDDAALSAILLGGGVSTATQVTGLSGRGVGLEVLKTTADELRGEVVLSSQHGRGTTIDLLIPISLSSLPALSLEFGGRAALVPLDSVRRTMRLAEADVARTPHGDRILIEGEPVPLVPLSRLLPDGAPRNGFHQEPSALVIESAGLRAALAVDRIGEVATVVVRSLPRHVAAEAVISGAALDECGVPNLVLAPAALVEAALRDRAPAPVATPPRLPLLVIDDSLTTRMLEQSILESAGYRVDLAVSAEEGLVKARARRYGAFIVDVEMPGMSGFDFIAHTRADRELSGIPSILVTSRADPADKRRGKEVGARAYIVKSEFDQEALLEALRRLVGDG